MQERVVDVRTRDGEMNTYVFHPDRPGPHPVVIFYMDSMGVREELADMCRRIATVGYYVLLPNLYYRLARSVDLDGDRLHDPAYADGLALMWKLNRSLSNTMVEQDTAELLKFLETEPAARKGKLGITGYCMSGRFVFRVAGAFADRVAAAASVYGARLITELEDSAHLLVDRIEGEMYFACAEHDSYVPAPMLAQLREIVERAGIRGTIEVYPEAHHGFAFPTRKSVYHKASSERHWERLFDLFRRNL
jgi:carboxymethylenebutenolidase